MTSEVNISQWIIVHVAEAVQVLWISIPWHNCICAQEPSQFWRIEARAKLIDPQSCDLTLTGEQLIGLHVPGGEARFAKRIEPVFAYRRSRRIGHDTRRAEMVFQYKI